MPSRGKEEDMGKNTKQFLQKMPHNYLQTCLICPIPKFQKKNFE